MLLANEQIEKIVSPFGDDRPGGESARYESEYEALLAEVGKQDLLSPKPVDWKQVVALGETILSQKSKDLLVAAYVAYGLFEQEGYGGLNKGLAVLDGLVKNLWESLFPEKKRMRGRVAALAWLLEKLERELPERRPAAADAPSVRSALEHLDGLEGVLKDKLADDAPDFRRIRNPLSQYRLELEKTEKVSAKPVAESKESAQAPAAGSSAPLTIESEADVPKALKACQDLLRRAAKTLRGAQLHDPRAYRLLRTGVWLGVDQAPPNKEGLTQIGGVTDETVARYEQFLGAGEYERLIDEAEAQFARAPFWLDNHRYVASALEALGPKYAKARAAVVAELGSFVERFPEVLEFRFLNETPFMSEQGRLWYQTEVQGTGPVQESTQAAHEGDDLPGWDTTLNAARKLAAKGKFNEGLALFEGHVEHALCQREAFVWRLNQSRFCLESGYIDLAIPQLEFLDQRAIEMRLTEWEPDLSIEVIDLLLRCYEKVFERHKKANSSLRRKADELYSRLCRLNMKGALEMYDRPWLKKVISAEYE